MNVYVFYNQSERNGTIVFDFLKKIKNNSNFSYKINAFIEHSFCDVNEIKVDGFLIKNLNQFCFDGSEVYEFRRGNGKILIRIFFVVSNKDVLFFGFLDKEHKPNYSRKESKKVEKKYSDQIFFTKEHYKKYSRNLINFINFKEI